MEKSDKIKRDIWVVIRKLGLSPWFLRWYPKSFLRNVGWFKSYKEWRPVSNSGEPLPWLNYSCIYLLDQRVNNSMKVFEFGAGYSTLWFSKRVKQIVSVEHNLKWAKLITNKLSDNGEVFLVEDEKNYPMEIMRHGLFNIILVDGIMRNECIQHGINALEKDGVIILDNAERKDYINSKKYLKNLGFRELPFIGLSPAELNSIQTSVFYRDGNCLGI